MSNQTPTLPDIISLCKRRGFVFNTSEIYGGLANCYDYGPLGTELLRNIKNLWWQYFVSSREDIVGIDSQIILHPETWVASGHVASFTDPMVEDRVTHLRYRADHLIEAYLKKQSDPTVSNTVVEDMKIDEMNQFIKDHEVKSPDGNAITEAKNFNLLFETELGTVSGDKSKVYLRGETAQGIFTNFKQILDSTRVKLPFGIAQMGKSFRNEITKGQFIFRTLEFEQAEIEYFFNPHDNDWTKLFEVWKQDMWDFVVNVLGIKESNLRFRKHTDKERSHYSQDTFDLEYLFPFGFKELWGVAYRTDYDLKAHIKHSKQDLIYTDPYSGEKMIPHVIEPALGLNRVILMLLCDAYWVDQENKRIVLKLTPRLAPFKAAVFPLVKNKENIVTQARTIHQQLAKIWPVAYDERGNIGKRYLYQDEMGTPVCITIDYQTLEDETVTVRDRDTTKQVRIKLSNLETHLQNMLK